MKIKKITSTSGWAYSTICRPKISPPKVIYKVQSMPYKSLPLGAFWTIFGRNFPTGVLQLLYPYQPANPLVESIFKALKHLTNKSKFPIFLFWGPLFNRRWWLCFWWFFRCPKTVNRRTSGANYEYRGWSWSSRYWFLLSRGRLLVFVAVVVCHYVYHH